MHHNDHYIQSIKLYATESLGHLLEWPEVLQAICTRHSIQGISQSEFVKCLVKFESDSSFAHNVTNIIVIIWRTSHLF